MPVGATIGAVGSLGSAGIGAWSSSQASSQQQAAQQASIANQQYMQQQQLAFLNQMYGKAQGGLQPFIDQGVNAGQQIASNIPRWMQMGQVPDQQTLAQTPGYQFTLNQGLQATNNQLAARGLGGVSGALGRGIADYTTGLANNTWQNVFNANQTQVGSEYNRLMGLMTPGASAAQSLAGVAAGIGGSGAQGYSNAANQISGAYTGMGNAQAAGTIGMGNAIGSLGSSLPGAYAAYNMFGGQTSSPGTGNIGPSAYGTTGPGGPTQSFNSMYNY